MELIKKLEPKSVQEGQAKREELQKQKLSQLIEKQARTGKYEYIVSRLKKEGICDQEDIDRFTKEFKELDKDGDGDLDKDDLEMFNKKKDEKIGANDVQEEENNDENNDESKGLLK